MKKEALHTAKTGDHEIVAGHKTPGERRAFMEKLLTTARFSAKRSSAPTS